MIYPILTNDVLLHLLIFHLGCNIFWVCVTCMLLTINYRTMQRNHFLYVLNQIEHSFFNVFFSILTNIYFF